MKGLGIFAAIAAGIVAMTPAPVSAYRGTPIGLEPITQLTGSADVQRWDDRRDRRDWNRGRGRGWDRGRHRWDRGRNRGWNNSRGRWRSVCRTEWRNGYRDRVCRRVRYR